MSEGIGTFVIGESAIGGSESDFQWTNLQIIPSYLYVEYNDDQDLQAFVDSYNGLAQQFLDWFNVTPLAIYTNPNIQGSFLNWVIQGIYGLKRPFLPSGQLAIEGPLNTYAPNTLPLNKFKKIELGSGSGVPEYYLTDDDTYRRILTWHFYKGDGKIFSIPWLKRRVMRFLFGANGTSYNIDQTYRVSVSFGSYPEVNINLSPYQRAVTGGTLPNKFKPNTTKLNSATYQFTEYPSIPEAPIFAAAVKAGVLELPFQFNFQVVLA